jgi:hypothetical protein
LKFFDLNGRVCPGGNMAKVKYKYGPGLATKREHAKRTTNEKLIEEFKNVLLHAVAHGDFQRPGFPFYYENGEQYLFLSGEWYQALKEEMLQRMSRATKRGE